MDSQPDTKTHYLIIKQFTQELRDGAVEHVAKNTDSGLLQDNETTKTLFLSILLESILNSPLLIPFIYIRD